MEDLQLNSENRNLLSNKSIPSLNTNRIVKSPKTWRKKARTEKTFLIHPPKSVMQQNSSVISNVSKLNQTARPVLNSNLSVNLIKIAQRKNFVETLQNLERSRKQHFVKFTPTIYEPSIIKNEWESTRNHQFLIDLDNTSWFITEPRNQSYMGNTNQ